MAPNRVTSPHPRAEQLSAFLERRITGAEREAVLDHLAECVECRRDVTGASRLLASAPGLRLRLPYVFFGVMAAGLIVLLVPRLAQRGSDRGADERSERQTEADAVPPIPIVSPADGARTGPDVVLVWRADAPNSLYKVAVLDSTGALTWSTQTPDTSARLPN